MKTSSEVIIFLGFFLWVDFVETDVYRGLINDNSRKREGGNGNFLNDEKPRDGNEFDRQEIKGGEKIDEETEVPQLGNNEAGGQDGGEQEVSSGEAGKETFSVLIGGKGICTCTCGEQGGIGEEDGSGTRTDTATDSLTDEIGENLEQGNPEEEANDKKDEIENEQIPEDGKNIENTNYGSGEVLGVGAEESGSETSTGGIGRQDENAIDEGHGANVGEEIFTFSPLDQ